MIGMVEVMIRNIKMITNNDILLVSFLGSGTSWVSNILLELNIYFIDAYLEIIFNKHSHKTQIVDIDSFLRYPALTMRNEKEKFYEKFRVIKTHFYPQKFNLKFKKIIILHRNPQDTIYSYYKWRKNFARLPDTRSYSSFLKNKTYAGYYPVKDWLYFYSAWLSDKYSEEKLCISYEKIKNSPISEIIKICDFININRSLTDIDKAVSNSTFQFMNKFEKKQKNKYNLKAGCIFRKGQIGEGKQKNYKIQKLFNLKYLTNFYNHLLKLS